MKKETSKKVPFTLEFPVRCSPAILYEYLSSPAGLQEWFADFVEERDGEISFSWNGNVEKAKMIERAQDNFIRMRWLTMAKDEYFEFRIVKSEVAGQTVLVITDFAEKNEVKDQSQLWDFQIKDLFHRLGS
jgi:uncharacterized protein YndB with AHSA1/START domain